MKLAGCVMIIFSGILLGLFLNRQLRARTEMISDLVLSLTAMQNEISFAHAPFEEAFLRLSRIEGAVGKFYLRCHEEIKKTPRQTVFEIWRSSLKTLFEPFVFVSREYDAMLSLGRELGTGDVDAQMRAIAYAIEELSRLEVSASEDEKRKTRMYMGLSIIAAAVIVIAAV